MNIKKLTLSSKRYPRCLRHIEAPPRQLYCVGTPLSELLKRPAVAIVGSRKPTAYGLQVTSKLAGELAEQGVVIVSGLAMGIDAAAHRAALEAGGLAIAVLPCPLQNIVPATNRRLAQAVLDQGGAIVSEYAEGDWPKRQYFIARNRLVSGLARGVIITEASTKSGSLYTANFAIKQGKEVMAVPGNVTSPLSAGTNNLLKAGQASAITDSQDVLNILGLYARRLPVREVKGRNGHEQKLIDLMLSGVTAGYRLLEASGLSASQYAQALTMLELGGKIRPLGADHWALS